MPTTIRINDRLHHFLKKMAEEQGKTMQKLLEEILERYKKEWIIKQHNQAYQRLSQKEWEEELEERKLWEGTLMDDLEKKDD